jgi:uncharacterized protein YgbK (DUF1537 family)
LTIEGAILDDVCLADFADRLAAAFAAGEDILILLSTSKGAPSRPEAAALLATLSELIAPYAASVGGLFATGGETARAILTGMGVTTLRLVSEIENGVPLSVAAAPRPFPVITKAGGFGDVTTMLNCRRALRELVSGGFGSALTRMAQQ